MSDSILIDQLPLLNRSLEKNADPCPEKIIQFGTGNFLKGFINWIVQKLNEKTDLNAGIVAVKLRRGNEEQIDRINAQDGLFTLNIRGLNQGELVDSLELIKSQNRALSPYVDFDAYLKLAELETLEWIVSNTTESGIRFEPMDKITDKPAESFPAKLTQLLYRRYCFFDGDLSKGIRFFCCELIDDNSFSLRNIIFQYCDLWGLDSGFSDWLESSCLFYNTLVDRIVTGKPPGKNAEKIQHSLGYRDQELIETEYYYQWVIESDAGNDVDLQRLFPESAGLNIILTNDLLLYRQRKVRILNGAHTGCVSIARLLNIDTVYESTQDSDFYNYMQRMVYEEICPTIEMPDNKKKIYADAILERFNNPFLHHEWISIGLNSISKWRTRLLPVLIDAQLKRGEVPQGLATSLACLFLLYRGHYETDKYKLYDDNFVIQSFNEAWNEGGEVLTLVRHIFSIKKLWGLDLSVNIDLVNTVSSAIVSINTIGLRQHLNYTPNTDCIF